MSSTEDGYRNPYGDLNDSRPQHSTFSYDGIEKMADDDESRGLIKTKQTNQQDDDLAMAVIDILSCCDRKMNNTQAQLLKDMESRFQDQGNLVGNEERQEEFVDEESITKKMSPKRWFRKSKDKPSEYEVRSSQFIVELPSGPSEKTSDRNKGRQWKCVFLVCAVMVTIIFVVVMWMTRLAKTVKFPKGIFAANVKSDKDGQKVSPFTSDCAIVANQENPSPLSQCACGGAINVISDQARERYETFLEAFGAEYLHENEMMSSCSSRNQALVWLAEDPGSTLSEVLVQRHSLVLFFIKMSGITWTLEHNQKWLTPEHECTWFGIICNDDKEVTGIELWNLGLEGTIPKEIMSLTSLERLSLPENQIYGELPVEAFVMMTKLTDLTLFMNSIAGGVDPRIFDSVTRLRTLNLDSNALTGPLPTEIGRLLDLEELKIAQNNLKGSLPSELGSLRSLKKIELHENDLYGTLPTEMGTLLELQSINLNWNDLQGPIPAEFQDLRNLRDLFLKSNDLGGTLPEIITNMGKLENLVLSLNEFSGSLPSQMNLMSSLSTVHLEQNKLTGPIPASLGSCTYLRDVRLDHNSMTGGLPVEIGKLAWLISLSLEGNFFTGVMPEEICSLRGEVGTLETLSATCEAESATQRNTEDNLIVSSKKLICRYPGCCTSCELTS